MRYKNRVIWITLAIVAVIAMVLVVLTLPSDRGVTPEHLEFLKPGMTQAEAEHLLHGPPRNDLKYRAIIWLPQATGKPISSEVAPVTPVTRWFLKEEIPKNGRQNAWIRVTPATDFFPQVTTKNGHQEVWTTRTGLIAVYFGSDGRLQHKYSSTVGEFEPPTVIDWLASRPRMIRQSLGF